MVLYAAFLYSQFTPAISEPDDNGYFAQGSLLAQTGKTWFRPESDAQYLGMHWLLEPDGRYVCRYPPGLAVVIGAVYALGGWQGCLWVNPALALLALAGFFLLAWRLMPAWWGLAGVIVLAANPTFTHHALTGDAHMGVACALAWGVYLLVRWGAEGRLWQAFAAGLVLGCIPTIRYADAIMGAGAALYLLWHWRRFPRIGWHYLAAVTGACLPIFPLLVHNQRLFGAFWRTGYSLTHEGTGFGWSYFQEHAVSYLRQLSGNGIGLFFALGFVGMLCMLSRRNKPGMRGMGLMLLVMAFSMLLVYMAYYWAPQMNAAMTLRFLLPTYLAYVLAGCWLLGEVSAAMSSGAQTALGAVVVVFQLLWGGPELWSQAVQLHYQKETLARVTVVLEKVANRGDVVVGSGNVLQQLDFVRHWKIADEAFLTGGGSGGMGAGGPAGVDGGTDAHAPSPMQATKVADMRQKYTGTAAARQQKFISNLTAWAGATHLIYIVGSERNVKAWNGRQGGSIRVVERVVLPAMPVKRRAESMGGGAAGGGAFPVGGGVGGFPPGGDGPGGPRPPDGGGPLPDDGQRRGPMMRGMPGGFGGPMGGFDGETEVVIAVFTPHRQS
jgi:hypothetical protein